MSEADNPTACERPWWSWRSGHLWGRWHPTNRIVRETYTSAIRREERVYRVWMRQCARCGEPQTIERTDTVCDGGP